MSPVAVPAINLASKTPAIKSNPSNLEDNLDELLRTDEPTEEERKAWSLEVYGTYRKSDYFRRCFVTLHLTRDDSTTPEPTTDGRTN